jgi:hypothetical protein
MDGECNTHRLDGRHVENVFERLRLRWEDNIKSELREIR